MREFGRRRDREATAALGAARSSIADEPIALLGSEIDPDLALDWWLRASRLPGMILLDEGRPEALAVVTSPDDEASSWRRLAWLLQAGFGGSPQRLRLLRRLAISERQRPSAPHLHVPVLLARAGSARLDAARELLQAIQARSRADPRSLGVCIEVGDEPDRDWLAALRYRPVTRFRADAGQRLCLFRPDRDAETFEEEVVVPIEDSIDLHRFRPAEIDAVLEGYLEAAWEAGFREVRIIHGRGRGVQRNRVQRRLARDSRVEAFADAPADRGGRGATLARLTPSAGVRRERPLDRD